MAVIGSVSRTDLAQRRQKLRRQRQIRILSTLWRTFAITGFAGGLFWISIQPMWVLKTPTQIVMKSNNKVLSEKTAKSLLALSYPQSLWRIQPAAIAQTLKQQPTISQAIVSRRLFPPGLIIEIQKRVPVAIAQTHPGQNALTKCSHQNLFSGKDPEKALQQCLRKNASFDQQTNSLGLVDADGVWIPLEKYIFLNSTIKLPSLIVIGAPEQYRLYWNQIYRELSETSVKITEIDCRDPSNLILKTELGNVHLGTPTNQLSEKIKILTQIRRLPSKVNLNQIEYIDLKNPLIPLVQMHEKAPDLISQGQQNN
jgi:cell division protein FtsQ